MPNLPWLRFLIPALLWGAVAWASAGSAAFVPPWMPSMGPLGGVWPPLLAFGLALLGLLALKGAVAMWPGCPRPLNASHRAPPHRFRIEPIDVLLGLGFVLAQYGVLDLYRDFYNPENQAIGHDNYAFLSTGVAAASGRWDLYMVDKRPLYGFLIAGLSPLFKGDLIHAAVGINMAAMSLVQLPMVLLGRFWGGRTAGIVAGLMYLGTGLFYPYAHEVSSYPLYILVSTTVVLAVSVALYRGTVRSSLIAGVVMGVLMVTQVKNFTFNIPMLGLLALAWYTDGHGHRIKRMCATLGPMALALSVLSATPVEFTPLNVLVMHHREEVNYEIPYTWEETLKADRANPSPLSPYLPDFLRGGEIEAVTGVMMTPPNQNVVSAFPQDGPRPRWEIVPATTIPPLPKRLSHNVAQFAILGPGLGSVLVPLLGLGLMMSVFMPTAATRRWFGLPKRWWQMGVLVVPLASCFGSLSLKFNLRYVFHAAPTVYVLIGIGVAVVATICVRRGGALWQGAARLIAIAMGVSLGLALYIRAPLMAGPLDETALKSAFFRLPPDARQLMGKGYRLVSTYIEGHVTEDTPVYDCTPIAVGLYRPFDDRLVRPLNGSERDKLCKRQLAAPPGETQRVMVVTSIPEFFGPDAVTPSHAARAGWTLLYGYDTHGPREVTDDEDLRRIGPGWIAVFTDSPSDEQRGLSMLKGASPTTTALAPDSPTKPNRSAGAPQAGNP